MPTFPSINSVSAEECRALKKQITQTRELLILLVTLLNVILNTYQDNSRTDSWQINLVYYLT